MRRVVLASVVVASMLGTGIHAGSAAPPEALPNAAAARWSGQAAIDHLADRLPWVAAEHGMSVAELRREFASDPSLFVDGTDRLLFVDPAPPEAAAATASATASVFDASIPDADTFFLHSRPGAQKVIYMDFDGHTISGTAWNNDTGGDCYADPYDTDKNPATFSSSELGVVKSAWKRVAEDYAPFDVDVTTEDPGYAAINRATSSDTAFGTRMLITNSTSLCPNGLTLYQSVCSSGCGGVAYVGTYDSTGSNHDTYQPALVFQNGAGSSAKGVTEAGSHEVGHNVGLSHDGTSTTSYYRGQGSWAPIMGVGYYQPITQWSKGEYAGANQLQDDFAVATSNGLAIRADDHGGTTATATVLSGTSISVDGTITTAADVDAFRVDANAGPATFTASAAPTSPDLDIRIEVRDANGALVAFADPAAGTSTSDVATGMSASVSTTLPSSGTYTILVDGVGIGDPLTTGYTDYGSVGNYRLSGSVTGADGLPPVAVASATPSSGEAPLLVTFNGSSSSDPENGALTYLWNFGDGTASSSEVSPVHSYAAGSYTATLTVTDSTGFTNSASTAISATVPVRRIDVFGMGISASRAKNGVTASATVTVRDSANAVVNGASVTGTWTVGGKAGATRSAATSNGVAAISSGTLKVTAGTTLRLCVSNLTLSGGTWAQALFTPTTATDCVSMPAP